MIAHSPYNPAITGKDKIAWEAAHSAEWLRLIESSECIAFIPVSDKPP